MVYQKILNTCLAFALLTTSISALANMYLGFDVGKQNEEAFISERKKESAQFDRFSYKGEGSLPFIRIKHAASLNKYGVLKEGIFMFDSNKVLFGFDLKYHDDGKTFEMFKNTLDKDFGTPREKTLGKIKMFTYDDPHDPDSGVQLILDESGKSKLTSVMYLNKKLFIDVQQHKKEIDLKIPGKTQKKN